MDSRAIPFRPRISILLKIGVWLPTMVQKNFFVNSGKWNT